MLGSAIRNGHEYGALLSGMAVKLASEAARAKDVLGLEAKVISNGVELPSSWTRPSAGPFTIGTLARLSPDKCLEQLLTAFERLPGARLVIGGEAETGSEARGSSFST